MSFQLLKINMGIWFANNYLFSHFHVVVPQLAPLPWIAKGHPWVNYIHIWCS